MRKMNIEAIKSRMEILGLNQSAIAKELGVSKESVSQWLKLGKQPRPGYLLKLSKLLNLGFSEIMTEEDSAIGAFAFRTKRNVPMNFPRSEKASDMLSMLDSLAPYMKIDHEVFSYILQAPNLSNTYIQTTVKKFRDLLGLASNDLVTEKQLILNMLKTNTIFIPVLWSEKGDDALHVVLFSNDIHFIYINLQTKQCDFLFWLLHEQAHILTPSLKGKDAETFADLFAAEFLFPSSCAKDLYNSLAMIQNPGICINRIIEIASSRGISPITIFTQVNRIAEEQGESPLRFSIYPATTNYLKTVKTVKDVLFEEEVPSVEKYIHVTSEYFGQRFWLAVQEWIVKSNKSPGAIQKLLDIPMSDAKGVWDYFETEVLA